MTKLTRETVAGLMASLPLAYKYGQAEQESDFFRKRQHTILAALVQLRNGVTGLQVLAALKAANVDVIGLLLSDEDSEKIAVALNAALLPTEQEQAYEELMGDA